MNLIVVLALLLQVAHSLKAVPLDASDAADTFRFEVSPEKVQSGSWRVAGLPRKYFDELLPALFERSLAIERFEPAQGALEWIFTGPSGGFTIRVEGGALRVTQRYYDSFGLRDESRRTRHPERITEDSTVPWQGRLRGITVRLDHRLGLSVLLNGRGAVRQNCLLDVSRHQLGWSGSTGESAGSLLKPEAASAVVRVDAKARRQTMIGFGGIAIPTAYAQLSPAGKRRWWELLAEYNLLLHREYPIGAKLNERMDNWDRIDDATPHYYGDNFPNGEISNFEYIRNVRRIGGKVLFEFWALPPGARRDWVDPQGKKYAGAADPEPYARAMVRYCQIAQERTGAPPEIVGIQNEVAQPPEIWHEMAVRLRRELDRAGFRAVKIHMRNDSVLAGGVQCARAFRRSPEAWAALDFTATNMYDYQRHFYNPDGYDALLSEWREAAGGKPFLSTELSVNNDSFQTNSYRLAFQMGQLYHKNLTIADASAILYCWILLNVEQPSYGWTRTLFVPDPAHGFLPKPSSHQLRVFGAYSRRVREGMVRVAAEASGPELVVTAFEGKAGRRTVVAMNRSLRAQRMRVEWPGAAFAAFEVVSPYAENAVAPMPAGGEVTVEPGSIVTLSNVELGRVPTRGLQP